ncbi:MAG: radical SAM protein [Desulfobacterales bacterium]|nr:radical SAM protein [Desulfobacterales bacterium]MBF0397546.1 radical SAM protein [Desulfobacterales bacterium]
MSNEQKHVLRVALIASPYPLEEAPAPPLGISYVASACEASGAIVKIFDYIVRKYSEEKLKKEIGDFCPDVIGTGSVTLNFPKAANIIRTAKKLFPDAVTMMGGPHVSFDIKNTLTKYPEIDMILVGEAEDTLKELLPVIKNKEKWKNINGIAFFDNGSLIQTPKRELICDLDSLPLPARHLLPMSKYQALGYPISIITSRGCPYKCIFCLGRKMVGAKVRYRNPKLVADEIEHILSYGINRINVADDLFTSNKERVHALCNEIKDRNLKFHWSAFARVNTVDKEVLKLMKDTGCDSICFGIESGDSEMLKRIKKGITVEQIKRAISISKEVGITAFASFIIGLPGETHESLKNTKEVAESLDTAYGYHMLAPFPGTTVREEIKNFDLEILTDEWELYDANRPIVRTSQIGPQDMEEFISDLVDFHKKKWDILVEQYKNDTCNKEDYLIIEGFHRTQLIFKLLSEDLIEDYGYFEEEGEPTSLLLNKMSELIDMEKPFIDRTIVSLISANYLKYEKKGNGIKWFWKHNKHVDHLE